MVGVAAVKTVISDICFPSARGGSEGVKRMLGWGKYGVSVDVCGSS